MIGLKRGKHGNEVLIVNDLTGNKIGNKGATDRQHLAAFAPVWLNLTILTGFRVWVFGNSRSSSAMECSATPMI